MTKRKATVSARFVQAEIERLQQVISDGGYPLGESVSWDKFNAMPMVIREAQERLWYLGYHQHNPEMYPI